MKIFFWAMEFEIGNARSSRMVSVCGIGLEDVVFFIFLYEII